MPGLKMSFPQAGATDWICECTITYMQIDRDRDIDIDMDMDMDIDIDIYQRLQKRVCVCAFKQKIVAYTVQYAQALYIALFIDANCGRAGRAHPASKEKRSRARSRPA